MVSLTPDKMASQESVRLTAQARTGSFAHGGAHINSWYAATADKELRFSEFVGSDRVDVCVIGGGLTGLATALELTERGARVAVLEANRVAWGASGRNGGHICSFTPCRSAPYLRDFGKDGAARVFAMTREGQERIVQRVERYGIDCDLRRGYYHACEGKHQMQDARELQREFASYGYTETQMLEGKEESCTVVNSPRYIGGLLETEGGHMHPLKYCQGMARAIVAQGGKIYEDTLVLGWERTGAEKGKAASPYQIYCAKGDLVADQLVVACNAYQNFKHPILNREILPVGSFVVATESLGKEGAESILPRDLSVVTNRNLGEYYRRTSDHRVLFGARANYSGKENIRNSDTIVAKMMVNLLPSLEGVKIDYAWGGLLAITARRAFRVGRLGTGAYYAHGYSGSGVLLTQVAAHAMAQEIDGAQNDSLATGRAGQGSDFALLEKVRAWQFPGGRMWRKPMLVLAGRVMQLQDLRK